MEGRRNALVFLSCVALLVSGGSAAEYDWSSVGGVLEGGISSGVFPGCTAMVMFEDIVVYAEAFGSFTYGLPDPVSGTNPAMNVETSRFDIASLTKVTTTTTAVMQFYQRGELYLDWKVGGSNLLGDEYNNNGKEDISVLNLLLHNAGYPPDPDPGYWNATFGCPESQKYSPDENFSCQERIYEGLMQQTLQNPVGEVYVYSDLSFITLMNVVGVLAYDLGYVVPEDVRPECLKAAPLGSRATAQCYYEAYVDRYVFRPLNMRRTGFLPDPQYWKFCPPAWNDTYYRHEVLQGVVNDENAYAMGGVAGHAGIFTTAPDIMELMFHLSTAKSDDSYVNSTTVTTFTTMYNVTQSSRALGWDTNDYTNHPNGNYCGMLDTTTYTHTGFTGTQICSDPVNKIVTILFTNRVYPDKNNGGIGDVRTDFNNAVLATLLG